MSKRVAVCGATGRQGGGVVAALLARGGFAVRALSRNPDSPASRKLAEQGVEVVKADFDDPASLQAAFTGCDAVFAVTDFWVACGCNAALEKQQGINLVDAAKAADVAHFVWSTLEDTRPVLAGKRAPLQGDYIVPHFDAKHEVEVYAREQLGAKLTALYTSIFLENLVPGGGMEPNKQPDGSYALFVPTGQALLSWCTTEDIGRVGAALIAGGPAEWGGKSAGVASEHATLAQVADTFSRVFGKQVAAVMPPADAWIEAVQGFGVPAEVAKDLGNMFYFYEQTPMTTLRPLEQGAALCGAPLQGLEPFLTAHKDKFAQLFA